MQVLPSPDQASLEELLADARASGRSELAAAMGSLASGQAAEGSLHAAPSSTFFEPRLYTQLVQAAEVTSTMTAEQLFFAARQERDGLFTARTDAGGVICLPGVGSSVTPYQNAAVTARLDERAGTVTVQHGAAEPVGSKWTPCAVIPGTAIEVVGHVDQVLGAFLTQHLDAPERLSLVTDADAYRERMAAALRLIGEARPAFHAWLVQSLRSVLLFRHPTAESFAALGMHGMIFLNVPDDAGTDYFVEELTHQGGHVVFSEATLNRPDYFAGDPDQQLSDFTATRDDRTLYDAFHGLYTEHMESQVVLAILRERLAAAEDEADFERHLRTVMGRHSHDVELIGQFAAEIFAGPGNAVYAVIERSYREAVRELLVPAPPVSQDVAAPLERSR
jgi:hypothetical protein